MIPDISVLMFSYRKPSSRRHQLIKQSILSLKQQTGLNIQAVILDDGSSEPLTGDIIKSTANVEIEYTYFPKNRGKHKMFDEGIPKLSAQLCTCLHDDDYLPTPDSLAKRLAFFKSEPNTAMIFTNATYIDEVAKKTFTLYPPTKKIIHSHEALLKSCYICGASYLLQTDLQNRFRPHPSLKHAEELDIWLGVSKFARDNKLSIRYSPEITAVYRMWPEQAWNKVRNIGQKERNRQYLDFIRNRHR